MQPIYCPACGQQNAFDAKFCNSCALSITSGQPVMSQPAARTWKDIFEQYRGIILFVAFIGSAFMFALLFPGDNRRPRASARERARPTRPAPPVPPAPPAPPAPPVPPAPPAISPPVPPSLLGSEALGVSREEWEQSHGDSERVDAGDFHHYENGEFIVRFTNSKVSSVEKVWSDDDAVSLEEAKEEAEGLIPEDAKFERSFTGKGGQRVDIYSSELLKQQFLNEKMTGGKPGNFIVIYKGKGDSISSILLAYGTNP